MSSAEWNVIGLTLTLVGILLLFRFGLPKADQRNALLSWLGLILLVGGTACQTWASVRWVN
jgi:drug/metabolite transporter (DMT)-like permease